MLAGWLMAAARKRGGAAPLLLDTYTGASVAYSLRKLRAAYSGAAVRVRRSSDNAEQDIGFSAEVLDQSALTTFTGAGDGFVVTWYDQSTNANHATQSTNGNQPRIVLAGVVDTGVHGFPVVQAISSDYIEIPDRSLLSIAADFYELLVADKPASGDLRPLGFGRSTAAPPLHYMQIGTNNLADLRNNANSLDRITIANSGSSVLSYTRASGNLQAFVNSSSAGTQSTTGAITIDNVSLFATKSNNGLFFGGSGKISEVIFWQADRTGSRAAIESAVNDYYGIF